MVSFDMDTLPLSNEAHSRLKLTTTWNPKASRPSTLVFPTCPNKREEIGTTCEQLQNTNEYHIMKSAKVSAYVRKVVDVQWKTKFKWIITNLKFSSGLHDKMLIHYSFISLGKLISHATLPHPIPITGFRTVMLGWRPQVHLNISESSNIIHSEFNSMEYQISEESLLFSLTSIQACQNNPPWVCKWLVATQKLAYNWR